MRVDAAWCAHLIGARNLEAREVRLEDRKNNFFQQPVRVDSIVTLLPSDWSYNEALFLFCKLCHFHPRQLAPCSRTLPLQMQEAHQIKLVLQKG
ncbi:hypothetical protein SAMN03159448_00212 [Sinorhizobium sp. NFACC03]|nr:hypothetical protein SAMN03159448_00212 [Sinorhizobium sp. NFACC03]